MEILCGPLVHLGILKFSRTQQDVPYQGQFDVFILGCHTELPRIPSSFWPGSDCDTGGLPESPLPDGRRWPLVWWFPCPCPQAQHLWRQLETAHDAMLCGWGHGEIGGSSFSLIKLARWNPLKCLYDPLWSHISGLKISQNSWKWGEESDACWFQARTSRVKWTSEPWLSTRLACSQISWKFLNVAQRNLLFLVEMLVTLSHFQWETRQHLYLAPPPSYIAKFLINHPAFWGIPIFRQKKTYKYWWSDVLVGPLVPHFWTNAIYKKTTAPTTFDLPVLHGEVVALLPNLRLTTTEQKPSVAIGKRGKTGVQRCFDQVLAYMIYIYIHDMMIYVHLWMYRY